MLLNDNRLTEAIISKQKDLRSVGDMAVTLDLPVPALRTFLDHFDGYRSAGLPANLIRAHHDDFGTHTRDRVDARQIQYKSGT